MIRYINTLTMGNRSRAVNLVRKCNNHSHLMDNSLSAMPPMSVEAPHQTRYYRQQDLQLRNIHHHLRYPRIQIELFHFLNCIHKSNKEYQ